MKYMRALAPVLALLSCLIWAGAVSAAEDLVKLVKDVKQGVVFIQAYDSAGRPTGSGSGFFINQEGDIITNRHVLNGKSAAVAKTFDGRRFSIKNVLAVDSTHDLMRVSIELDRPLKSLGGREAPNQRPLRPLKIVNLLPEVGERVVVIGNPYGLEQSVSDGIVAALRSHPRYGRVIQHTAPMSPGSSGGPLLNMKGMVIGVCTFQTSSGQNLNFAIPAGNIVVLKPTMAQPLTQWGAQTQDRRRGGPGPGGPAPPYQRPRPPMP